MFKEYRKKNKLTQLEVANLCEKDLRTIQRIENNEVIPSIETFAKLIKILNITYEQSYLLDEYRNK